MKGKYIVFLAGLMLLTLSFPQTTTPTQSKFSSALSNVFGSLFLHTIEDWRALTLIGFFVGLAFSALLYMGGEAFNIPLLKYYFRVEVKDLLATGMLVAFLIFGITLLDLAATNFDSGGGTCSGGFCFDDKVVVMLDSVYGNNLREALKTLSKDIANSYQTVGYNIGVESVIVGYIDIGTGKTEKYLKFHLLPIKSALESSIVMLELFKGSLIIAGKFLGPLLLLFGIFFRMFFFTKRMGSTLVALGIGMLAIYPFMAYMFYLPFLQPLTLMSYSSEDDCLPVCKESIVAFTSSSTLDSDAFWEIVNNYLDTLTSPSDKEAFLNRTREFLNGSRSTLEVEGITYSSCEYYAISEASILDDYGYNETYGYPNGLYCFSFCRKLPYPDDVALCRDAEEKCRTLYEHYPQCFTKLIAYKNDPLYEEILSFYGIEGTDEVDSYEGNCPRECRDVPNLVPGAKSSLDAFCPSMCRELFISYDGADYAYLGFIGSPSSVCTSIYGEGCRDYYTSSGIGWEPDGTTVVNMKGDQNDLEDMPSSLMNIPMEIKVESSSQQCGGCRAYPKPLRYYPITVDCSACYKNLPVPNLLVNQKLSQLSPRLVGKALFITIAIPLLVVITTIYATAGLSDYLSGEMFIPAINKLIPR